MSVELLNRLYDLAALREVVAGVRNVLPVFVEDGNLSLPPFDSLPELLLQLIACKQKVR